MFAYLMLRAYKVVAQNTLASRDINKTHTSISRYKHNTH